MERRLKNHEKFWRVKVEGDVLTLQTGPLGTPGTARRIVAKSSEDALKTVHALVTQRLRDGYAEDDGSDARSSESSLVAALEPQLLQEDAAAWAVLGSALMEAGDAVRGEWVVLQLQAQKRARGAIGRAQAFLRQHFDTLVGSELSAFHRQVFIEWRNGFAHSVKVWSGPHSEPIASVLEAVFESPASRYLRRLELGSPGNEGRYGSTLRELAKLEWPRHLDELTLGAFDFAAAKRTDTTWPIIESLAALQPTPQLKRLRVRAVLNTFGRGLDWPALEELWLMPSRVDARLLSDLASVRAPRLRRFALTEDAPRNVPVTALASLLRQLLRYPGVRELALHRVPDLPELLEAVGPDLLARLDELDLRDCARVHHAAELRELGPVLGRVRLELGDAPMLAKKLEGTWASVSTAAGALSIRADR